MGLIEYKIIVGTAIECQKWLNQWKHEFKIEILGFSKYGSQIAILLTRTKK